MQIGQILGKPLQHLENSFIIIDEDVTPHHRVGSGDPGEITEARRREADHIVFQLAFQIDRGADDGIGDQVRQMRCQRQHLVMIVGIHPLADRSHAGYEALESDDLVFRHLARQHQPVAAVKKLGKTGRRT